MRRRAAPKDSGSSWLTHDGEPPVKVARKKVELVKLDRTGALMCRKCGRRADEPVRHFAIMSIECDSTDWEPYRPPSWEVAVRKKEQT